METRKIVIITGPISKHKYSAGYAVTKGIETGLLGNNFQVELLEIHKEQKLNFLPWFIKTTLESFKVKPLKKDLQRVKNSISKTDKVILFEPEGIGIAPFLANKKLIILPDQPSLRVRYTLSKSKINKIKEIIASHLEKILIKKYYSIPNSSLAVYGAQHCRNLDIKIDLRPQLIIEKNYSELSNSKSQEGHITFAFGGTLNGTASKIALKIFKSSAYQTLDFTIVGYGAKYIGKRLNIPYIEAPENFEKTISQFDCFILAGDYPVGVRTRIISALSQGMIIISHRSVCEGMPELKDCESILFYEQSIDLLTLLKNLKKIKYRDRLILKEKSRLFYEKNYSLKATTFPIIKWVESH